MSKNKCTATASTLLGDNGLVLMHSHTENYVVQKLDITTFNRWQWIRGREKQN